jgi:hypothetical protein
MKVNKIELPRSIEAHLAGGAGGLTADQKERLAALLTATETALPELFDLERVLEANRFWGSPYVEHYLGIESSTYPPGNIDPQRTILIGQAEPDSPIALDFRCQPPRVVYFGDAGYWVELFPDYESLITAIGASAPEPPSI